MTHKGGCLLIRKSYHALRWSNRFPVAGNSDAFVSIANEVQPGNSGVRASISASRCGWTPGAAVRGWMSAFRRMGAWYAGNFTLIAAHENPCRLTRSVNRDKKATMKGG